MRIKGQEEQKEPQAPLTCGLGWLWSSPCWLLTLVGGCTRSPGEMNGAQLCAQGNAFCLCLVSEQARDVLCVQHPSLFLQVFPLKKGGTENRAAEIGRGQHWSQD